MLLTQRNTWKQLEHLVERSEFHVPQAVSAKGRLISTENITLDFSGQRLDDQVITLLDKLAHECHLDESISSLKAGCSLHPQATLSLHTALRAKTGSAPLNVRGENILALVLEEREKMRLIAEKLRAGEWLGFSGKAITDVVHVGIGGSGLGPRFCMEALHSLQTSSLRFHFISEVDAYAFTSVCSSLNPETTLFIVASKSFTTDETLVNAKKAIAWLNQEQHINKHFIAVTAYPKRAQALGFEQVLSIWDWVVGRFSVCSAINLITCIALGFEGFMALLEGAQSMDEHFYTASVEQNLPVMLALLGLWNNNGLKIHNHLLLTYSLQLRYLLPYIQQLDMESSGKSIDRDGHVVNYATGPIVWGGSGNHAQHSYYQLLCQGTHRLTADLVSVDSSAGEPIHHMCLAHKNILTSGVLDEEQVSYIPGHIPLNHIRIKDYSPQSIGALVALYEHKIFAQSVFWNIDPFNQPGVDSSKKMLLKQEVSCATE